jgi:phage terminase large subunit
MEIDLQSLLRASQKTDDIKLLTLIQKYLDCPLYCFKPRPDNILSGDQQESFIKDQFQGLACVLAGNGAGKSYCASYKIAKLLLETEPPEDNCPFWVLSKNMDMVTKVCWQQNLAHFIPAEYIQEIQWYSQKLSLPKTIVLKPVNGKRFVIELKSYDMNRASLQGSNIFGFWTDEQCDLAILREIWARTRRWDMPGTKFYTLTPIDPDYELEKIYNDSDKYPSWKFYRFNTETAKDFGHVTETYITQIKENELDDLLMTRLTGCFASFKGQIYRSFNPKVHAVEPFTIPEQWIHVRGLDFGWEHGTACIFAAKNNEGIWYVYKEYFQTKSTIEEHVEAINEGWRTFPSYLDTWADYADAQTRAEYSRRGLPTKAASKSVTVGIAAIQHLLRMNKLFVFKTCEKLLEEFRLYQWNPNIPGKPIKRNDDCLDALRYLIYSESKEQKPWKYIPHVKLPNRSPF